MLTQTWNEEDWIDELSRATDKPRMEYCEDQNGTILSIRALQGHSQGVAINPNLFSLKQILPSLERTHIPHGQLFQLRINLREWSMGRRITFEKHETSLLLLTSECARIVSATANDRLERTT